MRSLTALSGTLAAGVFAAAVVCPLRLRADFAFGPGFRLSCAVTFDRTPGGCSEIVKKDGAYLLRYDRAASGKGAFRFWPHVDGTWEPSVGIDVEVEPGRRYDVTASWTGTEAAIGVDGVVARKSRFGTCGKGDKPLSIGSPAVQVTNLVIRNVAEPNAYFAAVQSGELMPRIGERMTIMADVYNVGCTLRDGRVVATTAAGARVEPAEQPVPEVANGAAIPLSWRLDPGTNKSPWVKLELWSGDRKLRERRVELVAMPRCDPDLSAAAWNPPIRQTRAFYIDALSGDDARDGNAPETAWKSLGRARDMTLGPGERLLLRRGSVFGEELVVTAKASRDNWAEIGAYGEGPRPTIRRSRDIDDRCAYVLSPSCLSIRDLVVCNAGKGLVVECGSPSSGYVLMERCLAHHIEGLYRFNAHGIPEWRDKSGAPGGRAAGLVLAGQWAHHMVMRDCEMYQCSVGFAAVGSDVWFGRLFCHDNYCRNTSSHPYLTATRRAWIVDSIFDGSGWNACGGTMGVMLGRNDGLVVRGCHFVNMADSGSNDEGGIDFECYGNNALVEGCTFRNTAGPAIEVLGFSTEQAHNTHVRNCRFDRNNWAKKTGLGVVVSDGGTETNPSRLDRRIWNSSGCLEGNGYVLSPGIQFFTNRSELTHANWRLVDNVQYPDWDSLRLAMPLGEPPEVKVGHEVWTDSHEAILAAEVTAAGASPSVLWEQLEGPSVAMVASPGLSRTSVTLPLVGDYRFLAKADDGRYWRTARTVVHRLEPGLRILRAWSFSRNLDAEGWTSEGLGTAKETFNGSYSVAHPVRDVVGDYFVLAVKEAATAALVSPNRLSIACGEDAEFRVCMQNHTNSNRMKLQMLPEGTSDWAAAISVDFAVNPSDEADTVYRVPLATNGALQRLKLCFSADGTPVTGTVRVEYMAVVARRQGD